MIFFLLWIVFGILGTLAVISSKYAQSLKKALLICTWILPVFGAVIALLYLYLCGQNKQPAFNRAEFVKRDALKKTYSHPDLIHELNIVPVADAMAASPVGAKRSLLLSQLKKDRTKNYRQLIKAASDTDTETAHYASALRMEMYTDMENEAKATYDAWKTQQTQENLIEAVQATVSLLQSTLLSDYEAEMMHSRMKELCSHFPEGEMPDHFILPLAQSLTAADEIESVFEIWEKQNTDNPDQYLWMEALNCSVTRKDYASFNTLLELALQEPEWISDPNIQKRIDYWKEWRKRHAFSTPTY